MRTGIFVGLGWGLLTSLLDGHTLLLQGSMLPFLGSRLLALASLAVSYGALGALAGGLLGCIIWLALRATGRRLPHPNLAATVAGLLAAITAILFGAYRYLPPLAGWLILLLLALALGLAVRWLLSKAARARVLSWPTYRRVVVGIYLTAIVSVLGATAYRTWLAGLPQFNPTATDAAATEEQPNVVLVTAAGLRADRLGVYGHGPDITPNIDALARRGLRFELAFATASWTEPSLASLLTSLYPSELGIACRAAISCQPHLDEQRTTLAEALQGAGYRTEAYLTSPWLTAELGFAQGFDQFESVRASEPFDLAPTYARMLGWLLGCRRDTRACQLLAEGHAYLFGRPIPPGWGGDQVNARVNRFLELHGDERFFLWIHYSEALPPFDLEPPFRPMPEGSLASSAASLAGMGYWPLGDPFAPREKLLPLDVEGLASLYEGEVHRLDRLVGALAAQLEARGLSGRTQLVLTSDHGQEFLEHGGYTYGHSLYDEVLHVPLIFVGPGIATPGEVVETPVALLDVAPTLLELAGAPIPLEAEGRSLAPALLGLPLEAQPIYSESLYRVPFELRAVRQDGYKLIYRLEDGRTELYDLNADPSEQHDLSANAVQVAELMANRLQGWMDHTAGVARDLPRSAPPREFTSAVW